MRRQFAFLLLILVASGCGDSRGTTSPTDPAGAPNAAAAATADPASEELHAIPSVLPDGFAYARALQPAPWPASHQTFGGSVTISSGSGVEIEISTRWPNRPDPETGRVGRDDGPAPPPPTDVEGHSVRLWDAPTLVLSWSLTDNTTVWMEHPTADRDEIPGELVDLLHSITGVDDAEWNRITEDLPAE